MLMDGDYLTAVEAEDVMGLSASQIRLLARSGKLPGCVKMGKTWLVPVETARNYTPGPRGFAAAQEARRSQG